MSGSSEAQPAPGEVKINGDEPETVTQLEETDGESAQERLTDLTARATALYAIKKYEDAAELYSEATEIQAEINGEMSEDNADLLFSYGRCLFHVAQKTSTVLGGTAASAQLKGSDKKPSKKRKANGAIKAESSNAQQLGTLKTVTETSEPAAIVPAEVVDGAGDKTVSDKAYFHIEGDAPDWDDSDEDEEADGDAEGEDEEEDDDFNTAYEILDMARILYTCRLESNPEHQSADAVSALKTKIADIYDLQAEINLEGEKYAAAESDLQSCLELKQDIYSLGNAILAECHYKLSLALEAASQQQERDADGNPVGEINIDWDKRKEAATHQQKAIESCKIRIEKETADLNALPENKHKERQKAQEDIDDVKDIMAAMEQRLEELKKPPVSVKAETERDAQSELMGTVLGQMLGAKSSGKEEQKAILEKAMAGANDLTSMVKKRKPKPAENGTTEIKPELEINGKGKRKLDEVEANGEDTSSKKVRIEDVIN